MPTLNSDTDYDLPGPIMLARRNHSSNALHGLGSQTKVSDTDNASHPSEIGDDHIPEEPLGIDEDVNDDMEWTYNGSSTLLY